MRSIIIGTAGHIDHGKSALVRALTGRDPDRLPEEKRRGITIDLGFADLDLGDTHVGFVDVPGHERFVKNMLAGAHGIDAVALVIAADEGVMPQTREHFDICRLLGIKSGVVVLTKSDLAEPELIELVRDEARELVSASFLDDAPLIAVSVKTGSGLDELRAAFRKIASEVPPRSSEFVTRLPIDRVFTMKGFGTVVTGTLLAGEIREGDELELLPVSKRARARGVQVHGRQVPIALAGNRTAVNLGGIDATSIDRGMTLAAVGRLRTAQMLDVRLDVLPDAPRPIRTRARVRLHMHAAEVLGRVRVLDDSGLVEPGDQAFVQLRLETPVVAVAGDRFILRSYSPAQTMAGGVVLDPFASKHRGKDFATVQAGLKSLSHPPLRMKTFVENSAEAGLGLSALAARTGWTDEVLTRAVAEGTNSGQVINCDGVLVAKQDFQRLTQSVLDEVKQHHAREPLVRGLARETLRERRFGRINQEVFRSVVATLEHENLIVSDKEFLRAPEHTLEIAGEDAALRDSVVKVYSEAGLEPPTLAEAFARAGIKHAAHGRKILQLLLEAKTVIRIQDDLIMSAVALESLKERLREYAEANEPDRMIDVATFKDLAGVSRKYAIPLLEYFDRERITRRAGDKRLILKR